MRTLIMSGRMIVNTRPILEEVKEEYLVALDEEDRERVCTDDDPPSERAEFLSAWWSYEEVV